MRVLALAHQYVPHHCAGAETMLHSMLRALVRRGHEVDLSLSRQSGQPYEVDGVRVHPLVDKRDPFKWLRGADILVSHLENSVRAAFLGEWNNTPVALIHHNTMPVTKETLTTPSARVDLVAVNSEWMAADLAGWLRNQRAPQPRTVVVRPLVDPEEYGTTPGDRVTLVNLRRMDRNPDGTSMGKGAEMFWALAQRMPNVRFLGVKGAYGNQMIQDLPNVEILEHMPHDAIRDKVLARTRVLLMPSSYESWGRIGTEALCSGIPVVAHPTPGLRENLGDAGIFIDRNDVDGWCRALQTLAMPGPYGAAAKRALARAEQLRPEEDLARWCDAVEQVAARSRMLAGVGA